MAKKPQEDGGLFNGGVKRFREAVMEEYDANRGGKIHGVRCGCCGRTIKIPNFWCNQCKEDHVLEIGTRTFSWERTYMAQHGTPCPYKEKTNPMDSGGNQTEQQ